MKVEEAIKLKGFKEYCNCGGSSWNMNGRNPLYPHLHYCPQLEEHNDWIKALLSCEKGRRYLKEKCYIPEKYIIEEIQKNKNILSCPYCGNEYLSSWLQFVHYKVMIIPCSMCHKKFRGKELSDGTYVSEKLI